MTTTFEPRANGSVQLLSLSVTPRVCFSLSFALMILQQQRPLLEGLLLLLNRNLPTNLVILRGLLWRWVW